MSKLLYISINKKFLEKKPGSPHCGTVETNPTRDLEVEDSVPGLAQWVKDLSIALSCGVGADMAWILSGCGCGIGR